ncbi:hypothetical protein RJ641_010325 [Dillenia turbinata]|uniref:Uncharacterized protein n=1 Tax=Dillenia turbinata TaxID=194707 RepID=A0AAN8UY95_9MAGN
MLFGFHLKTVSIEFLYMSFTLRGVKLAAALSWRFAASNGSNGNHAVNDLYLFQEKCGEIGDNGSSSQCIYNVYAFRHIDKMNGYVGFENLVIWTAFAFALALACITFKPAGKSIQYKDKNGDAKLQDSEPPTPHSFVKMGSSPTMLSHSALLIDHHSKTLLLGEALNVNAVLAENHDGVVSRENNIILTIFCY